MTEFANGVASLAWTRSPEKNVNGYVVAWAPPGADPTGKAGSGRASALPRPGLQA